MKLKLAVTVMAILSSIVMVSTLVVPGNIDARASGNLPAGSSGESGFYTAVCGPDPTHACQSPAEQ